MSIPVSPLPRFPRYPWNREVVSFGDSLLDTGNISRLASLFGETPFPPPKYSEGKASDGEVVLETVLGQLGRSGDDGPVTRFPGLAADIFFDSVNYSIGGATSGQGGGILTDGTDLSPLPIGLQNQVDLFLRDYHRSSPLLTSLAAAGLLELDAVISGGANDLVNVVTDGLPSKLLERWEYAMDLSSSVVDNITGAVDRISPFVDQIVILGLPPLQVTPLLQRVEKDDPGIGRFFQFVTNRANRLLQLTYDFPLLDRPDVLVISLPQVFSSIEAGAGEVGFVDELHPSALTNRIAAEFIAAEINAEMPGFGAVV